MQYAHYVHGQLAPSVLLHGQGKFTLGLIVLRKHWLFQPTKITNELKFSTISERTIVAPELHVI